MVAVTLTHGGSFGAQVTVDGLGLTLGHGMSRFDPHPGHPNAPGPGKRPVHNMCPSLVLRDGVPVMALGAAGGLRIPNCVFDVLMNYVLRGAPMGSAVADPRLQSTGTLDVAGRTDTINGLSGAGTVDNSTGSGALTVGDNNQSSTFSGAIKNTSGSLALTKTGTGTLTLSGANTYDASTTISAGVINIQNNTALGSTAAGFA